MSVGANDISDFGPRSGEEGDDQPGQPPHVTPSYWTIRRGFGLL